MPKNNDVYSVIVPATSPNLSAHTYTTIYGGSSGCAISVNGVSINVAASSNITVQIRTVSGGSGCYLLGDYSDVYLGSTNI